MEIKKYKNNLPTNSTQTAFLGGSVFAYFHSSVTICKNSLQPIKLPIYKDFRVIPLGINFKILLV
jgi:hypothetical protein